MISESQTLGPKLLQCRTRLLISITLEYRISAEVSCLRILSVTAFLKSHLSGKCNDSFIFTLAPWLMLHIILLGCCLQCNFEHNCSIEA